MNYAPHTLTAKLDLGDIPQGSLLTYTSDIDDVLTYRVGSRACTISLEDATNGEYFEMAEVTETETNTVVESFKSILIRLLEENGKTAIAMGILASLVIFVDITGLRGEQYPIGFASIGTLVAVAYWLGLSTLIRKIAKGQLNKWATGFTASGLYVLYVIICATMAGDASPVRLGMIDMFGFYMAIRAMRLSN